MRFIPEEEFMKTLILTLTALFTLNAQASDQQKFLDGYAKSVYQRYAAATAKAKDLDLVIQAFVANPTAAGLQNAREAWTAARPSYAITEVYRFYDGPIDDEDGPEGNLNSWPLDENYIDYVFNKPDSGIINHPQDYPNLIPDEIAKLNEGDGGEKNIATGWHAIEFLLWGQDRSATGPGNRTYTDFVDGQLANADRRRAYLSALSTLLVSDLQGVADEWNPSKASNYVSAFLNDQSKFAAVIESARFLASDELSGERMQVAYESRKQEDEHSCFSDTTSNDIYYNFEGIKNVLTENYGGVTFLGILKAKDPNLAAAIEARLVRLEKEFSAFQALPEVFDQAILNTQDRVLMRQIIDDLKGNEEGTLPGLAQEIGQALEVLK
jgi:putative iron-regulated protein